jgi:hypothetical protein
MRDDESEVCGGKGRRIQRRAARGSQKSKPKRRSFTKARRKQFLNHFAASCNTAAAARAVGISENCVHVWRKKDEQFNAGWNEALGHGYARLEAETLRSSIEAVKIRPRKAAAVRVGSMDAKTAVAVLEAYRRSGGRAPGTIWPHPYDIEAVRRRLDAKMRALGAIEDGGEGPSTACGGPPPPQMQGRMCPGCGGPAPDAPGEHA